MSTMKNILLIVILFIWSPNAKSSLRGLQDDNNKNNLSDQAVPLPLVACDTTADCDPYNCFVPPCDENKCVDGWCTRIETENRNDAPTNGTVSNGGLPCGSTTCDLGKVCCNDSCGICTEVGGICTEEYCGPDVSTTNSTEGGDEGPEVSGGESCGSKICDLGEVCCNDSCGICTEPGGLCTMQYCGPSTDIGGNSTTGEDEIQDEEDDGDGNVADGTWISVTRGDCECQDLCSVCQKTIFGVCITMYCFP